jgi:hypothetical protein
MIGVDSRLAVKWIPQFSLQSRSSSNCSFRRFRILSEGRCQFLCRFIFHIHVSALAASSAVRQVGFRLDRSFT